MVEKDPIFSSLRSKSKGTSSKQESQSKAAPSDSLSTSASTNQRSFINSAPVNINTSKNVTIWNNTLIIGASNQTSASFQNRPRLKLSTDGLKTLSKAETKGLKDSSSLKRDQYAKDIQEQSDFGGSSRKSTELELAFHDSRFSTNQVMIDISTVWGAKEGDLAELKTYRGIPKSKDKKIYFIVKDFDPETRRRMKGTQISLLSGQLQHVLDLPVRSKVWIKLKDKNELGADLVELHVKDCNVNRGDMWKFSSKMYDSCVFLGQRILFIETIRAVVKGIYRDGRKVLSGYISEKTKIVYRSESAKILFLIQITDEMWHFEENGEETFHKFVNSLFPKIFTKWKSIGTHHSISIIFCASVDRSASSFYELHPGERLKNTKDYYRVVVDQVNIVHWVEIMKTLRKEFIRVAKDLRNVKLNDDISVMKGSFPSVIKSNLLETINFAASMITDPFKQNDLRHTTTHAIIITAGSGLYDVDYDLLKITDKKLLSLEITMDLICLTRPPLHMVPLFRYIDYKNQLHYCTPSWLSISFWNDTKRMMEWHPRCKIYDVLMMGLTETELKEEIALDTLQMENNSKSLSEFMATYDHHVFDEKENRFSLNNRNTGSSENLEKRLASDINMQKKHFQNDVTGDIHNYPFRWQESRPTDALLQPTFKEQVFAQLSPLPSSAGQSKEVEMTEDSAADSLALSSLKMVSEPNTGVTKRIFSKFFPELSSKRSFEYLTGSKLHSTSIEVPQEPLKTTDEVISSPPLEIPSSSKTQIKGKVSSVENSLLSAKSALEKTSAEKRIIHSDGSMKHRSFKKKALKNVEKDNWIEIENPSIPVDAELAGFLIPDRWKDVFPKFVAKKYTKWRSFTTPAELPLTTSMFPMKDDFEQNFILRNHTVSLNLDQENYEQTAYDLLQNMIYLRLLTGFQFCRGEDVLEVERTRNKDVDSSTITHLITEKNFTDVTIYMRIDNEIHRIVCFDEIIDVQRFIRNEDFKLIQTFAKYTPYVKTRFEAEYREVLVDPVKKMRDPYNWNQLDQVLAGYGDMVSDSNSEKCFRSKFVLLPAEIPPNTFQSTINGRKETLSAEEIRLEGLRKLISSISRSRLRSEEEKRNIKSIKEEILPEVLFYTGYLFDFIEDQNEILRNSGAAVKDSIFLDEDSTLTKDVELSKLSNDLQNGVAPINLVNRKWHWKRHQNCFVGLELVNWLIEHFSDIDTREEAVEYGQELMNRGLFNHVESRHGFLDGHYFYQLRPEYIMMPKNPSKNVFKYGGDNYSQRKASTGTASMSTSSIVPSASATSGPISEEVANKNEDPTVTVMLSNALKIDLDPGRQSYKLETCIVHYDRVHNPDHCFHIRLEWLTATPKLIEDLITNWSRIAERYGLKLVEIPWDELCNIPSISPFHSFMNIKLAINPWLDPEFRDEAIFREQKFFYHTYLLEGSGFLLDNRASKFFQTEKNCNYQIIYSWGKPMFKYAQYIHYSGACMAEIRENGDLFLAPNNLHISRVNIGNIISKSSSSPRFALDAKKVMLKFRKTCENYQLLRGIFLEAREKHLENRGNFEDYSNFQSFSLYT